MAVAEDLAYLREQWIGTLWDEQPTDDALRRGSVVLRGFLLQQLLQKAWRHHGLALMPSPTGVVVLRSS
jgi:hypothetical protein